MGMMHYDFTPFGGVNEQVAASRPDDRELRVYGLSASPAYSAKPDGEWDPTNSFPDGTH